MTYHLDLFESQYDVPEGMAYNSYLIQDEKVAILDTADARMGRRGRRTWRRPWTAARRIIWWCTIWNRTTRP